MPKIVRTPSELAEFLRIARERFDFGREADAADRQVAEEDNRFAYAEDRDLGQWDKAAKKARKKRPVLQWNRLPTYIHQVTNDGRQNKPSIRIAPEDQAATPETADFFQSRIRHIEYEANADTARDTAREQQVVSGRGWMAVSTEWVPGTQKQRILIERIENQFSVVDDPNARCYDRSDSDWRFIVTRISKAEHIRKYGQVSVLNSMDFTGLDDSFSNWVGLGEHGEMIQIAEYWHKEYHTEIVPASIDGQPARSEEVATVHQDVIDGAQILSETVWLGSTLPQVPVWGEEYVLDGLKRTRSLIRPAKEPSRVANLFLSNMAEQIGQMPKTPYLVPKGGIAPENEGEWENALNTPLAYLYFLEYDEQGRELSQPARVSNEPPIQALLEGLNTCFDGIKAAMGIFDSSIGQKSNETSGIAIERRRRQSNLSNSHFADNEARSNKYLGQILIELIQKLDRPGSSVPVRTADGKTHLVPIGTPHQDRKTGQIITHDLKSGQYGVSVSTGPSVQSQRQEAEDRDTALVTAQPELMWAIGPQMFRADDSAGSEERAEALERYIAVKFPQMAPPPGKDGPQQQQAAMQQAQQKLQQVTAENQKLHNFAQSLHEQLQTKQPELAMEKYKVDEQERTKRVIGLASIDQRDAIAYLTQELGSLNARFDRAHEQQMQAQQHQHEADQAGSAQQAAAEQQANAQQAAMEQQQQQEPQQA